MNNAPVSAQTQFRLSDVGPIIAMHVRAVVAGAVVFGALGLVVGLATPKQYRATALLQIVPRSGQEVEVDRTFDIDVRGGFQEIERYYRTQLQMIRTRSALQDVIRRYRDLGYTDLDEAQADALRGRITVVPRERSQLFEVSATAGDAESAAVLANLVVEVYVQRNLSTRQEAATEARRWLEVKLSEYETSLEASSLDMLEFKRTFDMVDVEETVTALTARMSALNLQYGDISTERVRLESRLDSYRALSDRGDYSELAGMLDSPVVNRLATLLAEARSAQATLAGRYGPKHPELVAANERISGLRTELATETSSVIQAEKARLSVLRAEESRLVEVIDTTKVQLLEKDTLRTDFEQLSLVYDRNRQFYKMLAKRADELDLTARTQLNNASLVDAAVPRNSPVQPRPLLNMLLGTLTGLALGLGWALARETFNDSIDSPDDVSAFLDLPLIGVMPAIEGGVASDLLTHTSPRSLPAEAARAIRAMLELRPSGEPLRRVLVTSSIRGEGKTSSVVRMGIAFAQAGRRVLLVEGDHRRPRLHQALGVSNKIGVMSVLRHDLAFSEAFQDTAVPNLWVMPRGPNHDQSQEILGSSDMQDLLDVAIEQFDIVIVDTPPSATLSEAVSLSPLVDGVIMVVQAGRTSRSVVRHTVQRFNNVGANMIGVVLNNVTRSWGTQYGYYGYKGYRYGGYEESEEEQAS